MKALNLPGKPVYLHYLERGNSPQANWCKVQNVFLNLGYDRNVHIEGANC